MANGSQPLSQGDLARLAESIEYGVTPDQGKKRGRKLTPREVEQLKVRVSEMALTERRAERVDAHKAAVRQARSLAHSVGLTQEEREGARPDHLQRLQAQRAEVQRAFAPRAHKQPAPPPQAPPQQQPAPEGRQPRFPPQNAPEPAGTPAQG